MLSNLVFRLVLQGHILEYLNLYINLRKEEMCRFKLERNRYYKII